MRLRRIHVLLAVLVSAALCAPLALAAPGKTVNVSITGDAVAGRTIDFAVTISNPPDAQQQVGSLNITPPAGWGPTVEFRNLALAPGESMPVPGQSITVPAAVPCGVTDATGWSAVAKQSNNFNGPPGNEVAVALTLNIRVVGACQLRFGTQPADARTGAFITGSDYDPAGPPVTVEKVDGAGAVIAGAPVTLTTVPAVALGGTTTGSSFSDLTIATPGTYRLHATDGSLSVDSAEFLVDTDGTVCVEDVLCHTSATTGKSQLDLTAEPNASVDAGLMRLSYDRGLSLECDGYDELTAGTAVFDFDGNRAKVAQLSIDKKTMASSPNNGASFLQVCFGAPKVFAAKGALDESLRYDWNGDGVTSPTEIVYKGLLSDCGVVAPPCVSKRQKTGSGVGIIETLLPPGDPAFRG